MRRPRGPGVVLGEHILEHGVVPLDRGHGLIDGQPDGRLLRLRFELRPAGLRRHPEDVFGDIFVAILRGIFAPLG